MWYIVVEWPEGRSFEANSFDVASARSFVDETGIIFKGYGSRKSIRAKVRELRNAHAQVTVRAFWMPDALINVVEAIGDGLVKLAVQLAKLAERWEV